MCKDGKNKCCNETMRNVGLMALRVAVGVIFIYAGWMKLGDIGAVAGMFAQNGLPLATFFAWLVALVEFVGGLAVLLGVYLRIAAKLLAFIMIVALLWVHTKMPFATAQLPIALLGGTLALAGVGGGKWKLIKKECVCGVGECCQTKNGDKQPMAGEHCDDKKPGGCC